MTNDYQITDGVLCIPPGISYIRSQQFCQRDDIEKIIVSDGLGFMEDECFCECANLREVILPRGLINIGPAAFAECPKLCRINIPQTVKSIDCGAFIFCEALREISLPQGLETIAEYAFQNSGLQRVQVPASVKTIGECGFFSCEQLIRADVLGEDTELLEDAFGSNYKLIEGYMAPGYPKHSDSAAELLYTLLWCSCPERHGAETSARAERFIRDNQAIIMEHILKADNIPAMTGLAPRGLLGAELIDEALKQTLPAGQRELTALLLQAKNAVQTQEEEFIL